MSDRVSFLTNPASGTPVLLIDTSNRPHVVASAIVGVGGLQKIILDSVLSFSRRTNVNGFAEKPDAFRWLATQA